MAELEAPSSGMLPKMGIKALGLNDTARLTQPGKTARIAGAGRQNSRGVKGPYDFLVMKDIAELVNPDWPLSAGKPTSQNAKYQVNIRDNHVEPEEESPSYRVPGHLLQLRRYESDTLKERAVPDYSPANITVDTRTIASNPKGTNEITKKLDRKSESDTPLPDFQLHLDVPNGDNITELLRIIDQDLSSQTFIHDWDRKLSVDPVKSLLSSVRSELSGYTTKSDSYILNHSIVDRVCTINGVNHRRYLATGYHDVSNHLLPANVSHATRSLPS